MKKLLLHRDRLKDLKQVAIIAGSYFVYMLVRKFVISDVENVAFDNALKVIAFEIDVGIFVEQKWEAWVIGQSQALIIALNWIYIVTFIPILMITAIFVYYKDKPQYFHYRNIWLLSFVIALLVFAMFPLAPPRFMPEYGFVDAIQRFGPSWYGGTDMAQAVYYNVFAAMPSLHFGWTIFFGIIYFRMRRPVLMVFGVMYPAMTFFAITLTGNHYMMDAVGGAGVILITFLVYQGLLRLKSRSTRQLALAGARSGRAMASFQGGLFRVRARARQFADTAKCKYQTRLERLSIRKWKAGFPQF